MGIACCYGSRTYQDSNVVQAYKEDDDFILNTADTIVPSLDNPVQNSVDKKYKIVERITKSNIFIWIPFTNWFLYRWFAWWIVLSSIATKHEKNSNSKNH